MQISEPRRWGAHQNILWSPQSYDKIAWAVPNLIQNAAVLTGLNAAWS